MTNFDIFTKEQDFTTFVEPAVSAERIYQIDPAACVLNCRRAMEAAVKWMYSVDAELVMPYQDNLISLINTDEFRDIVDDNLLRRMDFIRKTGNIAAHAGKKISKEQAALCLENLYIFFDFVAYCYADEYQEGTFDHSLLEKEPPVAVSAINPDAELKLEILMAENAALKEELTARRVEQQQTYVPKPLDISEYKTRKLYIDAMLEDAGWIEGKNWINEYEIPRECLTSLK